MNENILVCKDIKYYSRKDEDAFFEWLKKIDCVDDFMGEGNELHLYIAADDLHDHDLRDLLAIFYRYNIDMKQLAQYLTPDNESWFKDPKKYWYAKVFDAK